MSLNSATPGASKNSGRRRPRSQATPSTGFSVACTTRHWTGRKLRAKLFEQLAILRPTVLLIQGWAEPFALLQLEWALRHRVPTVITSESTAHDAQRNSYREKIKARVVRLFDAGLVGGQAHASYLHELGMPQAQIFQGYDAVDNRFFAAGAEAARAQAENLRAQKRLPTRYFLASARFIAKKNLANLIEAYAVYHRRTSERSQSAPWSLVILGDGPLRASLTEKIGARGLEDCVQMPGFQTYQDLPIYYGLAGAFIHASTTEQWGLVVNEAMAAGLPVIVSKQCGCAADLVEDGKNGFCFDAADPAILADRLEQVASATEDALSALGTCSERRIAAWSPERFAQGLQAAVATAVALPRRPGKIIDHALLRMLIYAAGQHRVQ